MADDNRLGTNSPDTPEGGPADVDMPEERAGSSIVSPDALYIAKGDCAQPARDNDRRHPGTFVSCCGRSWIVGTRDGDGFETTEGLLRAHGTKISGQVGVVQPRTIGPGEVAAAVGTRAKSENGVAIGNQALLKVPGQGTNGSKEK